MQVKQWDKPTCREVGKRIEAALKGLEEELGVVVSYRGGSFGEGVFTSKVDIAIRSEDGTIATREAESFRKHGQFFGVEAADLGREFQSNGRTFTLTGLKPGNARFPFTATRDDGRAFKFGEETIRRALGKEARK